MPETLQIILGSTIATTLATSIISYFLHRRTERFNADFEWKKETAGLLGQVYIYLNRTRLTFENTYSKLEEYDPYYEDEIIYTANKHIRDLILENGHHVPPELLEEASKLVEHYDAWLVKYNNLRKVNNDTQTIQVFVGGDRFPFPVQAEEKFKQYYIALFNSITTPSLKRSRLQVSIASYR